MTGRFQFSLRVPLVAMLVIGSFMGGYKLGIRHERERRRVALEGFKLELGPARSVGLDAITRRIAAITRQSMMAFVARGTLGKLIASLP